MEINILDTPQPTHFKPVILKNRQGIPFPVTKTKRRYVTKTPKTIEYFTAILQNLFLTAKLFVAFNGLIQRILHQGISNNTKTKEGKDKVENV